MRKFGELSDLLEIRVQMFVKVFRNLVEVFFYVNIFFSSWKLILVSAYGHLNQLEIITYRSYCLPPTPTYSNPKKPKSDDFICTYWKILIIELCFKPTTCFRI
ncbi:hypothetical protein ACKWTF_012976 [Chironomus riparius]